MNPEQINQLLDIQLIPYAPLVAIFVEAISSALSADSRSWSPPAWVKAVTLLVISFGICAAKASVAPAAEHALAALWPVQGMVFFVAAVLSHKAAQAIYATPAANQATAVATATSDALSGLSAKQVRSVAVAAGVPAPGTKQGGPGVSILLGFVLAAGLALGLAPRAGAEVFSILSSRRLSAGLEAQGVITENDSTGARSLGFEPRLAAGYNVTAMLDLGLGVQGDLHTRTGMAFVAARDCLNPDDPAGPRKSWHLYAGVDGRHYFGQDDVAPRNTAAVVIQGAWAASRRTDAAGQQTSTRLFVTGTVDKEIERGRTHARIGLKYQAWGGK